MLAMSSPMLDHLLRLMTEREASDLHLKPTRPPLIRVHGRLQPLGAEPLKPEEIGSMVSGILQPQQQRRLDERMSVDLGYGVRSRPLRGNIYMQRGPSRRASGASVPDPLAGGLDLRRCCSISASCRWGSFSSPVRPAAASRHPRGPDQYITGRRPVHVVTIEDPMEFIFTDGVATISQREVGTDTPSFAEALRNVMRQDPDVIMVGEMRDPETVATVITAAETGHLVFSTLHTNSARRRSTGSSTPSRGSAEAGAAAARPGLQGVVSMQLVERSDGSGLIAALEVMKSSPKIAQLIEKGRPRNSTRRSSRPSPTTGCSR